MRFFIHFFFSERLNFQIWQTTLLYDTWIYIVHDTPVWLSLTLSHRCSSCTVYTRSRATVCWSQWNSWMPHSPLDPRSAGRGASRWTRKGPSSWPREKCLLPLDPYPRSNSSRCHRYLFRKNVRFNKYRYV